VKNLYALAAKWGRIITQFVSSKDVSFVKKPYCVALLVAFCMYFAAIVPLHSQSKSSSAADPSLQNTPVFRTSSRLVVVNVIATNDKGEIVPGLKPGNFTVLEDGKPQRLWGFSSRADSVPPPTPATPVELPPHQFTNINTTQRFDRAITIVLLDKLNTTGTDQAFARQQMIEFLKHLPEGERVALFALGTRLTTIQGFSGKSDELIRAATALMAKTSPHLTTQSDREDAQATVDALTAGLDSTSAESVRETLERAISEEEAFRGEERIQTTLRAINALTRAVSGYPGRKTLLWLSADFPFRLGPDFAAYGLEHFMRDHSAEVKETEALLANAQVAVYPIDIRGLPTIGFQASSPYPATVAKMHQQSAELYDSHQAMNDIAKETGGQAYYNMNDIRGAMSRAVADEARYYTLAYIPENHDWNGKYRKIEIRTDMKGLRLNYRRGYFAVEKKELNDDDSFQMFQSAFQPYLPEYTMLLMRVQVLPPDATHKAVRIDYAVDAHDVSFYDPGDQHQHAVLDFMATARDKDNIDVAHAGKTVRAALPPQSYAQVLQTGIPLHQELELKPGTYTLRLGVIDRGSQRIGTLNVPVTVPVQN
jgi:VWFA-related protein